MTLKSEDEEKENLARIKALKERDALRNFFKRDPKQEQVDHFTTKDSGLREQYAGMQRDVTSDKTLWHLVTAGPMLRRWAELLTRGAKKYTPHNWEGAHTEEEYERFRESAFRHFVQWYYGETDEDHAAAILFNVNGAEYVKQKMREERNTKPTSSTPDISSELAYDLGAI